MQRKIQENEAFARAILQWNEQLKKKKYKHKTADFIVAKINKRCGTDVNASTVRRYVCNGEAGATIRMQGKKNDIPEEAFKVIKVAMVSHIQLSNAGMNKMPDRKYMIRQLMKCLKTSMYVFKRMDSFYDRIMESVAHKISVNTSEYKMEKRRLRGQHTQI